MEIEFELLLKFSQIHPLSPTVDKIGIYLIENEPRDKS